jgi:hypothetical protein
MRPLHFADGLMFVNKALRELEFGKILMLKPRKGKEYRKTSKVFSCNIVASRPEEICIVYLGWLLGRHIGV